MVTLDVTDQEMAQRRNEQLLRELSTILDGSTAGIAYLRGSVLVRCNRRFERMLGLAPGVQGANRTGRPFTGDYAGDLLYATLGKYGFAEGVFRASPDDGLTLRRTMISNAVRCVPPQNKPETSEIRSCNAFLRARIDALPNLKAVVALGRIAHDGLLTALGERKSAFAFGHGAEHQIGLLRLFDSYHCSRYNTNTGVLTPVMFEAVFARVKAYLG